MADGSVVLNTASLIFSTAHDPARVDTALLAADVDAAHSSLGAVLLGLATIFRQTTSSKVAWIPREAIDTDAGAVVVVGDAARVWPALYIAAGIHTPVLALYRLADLIVAAVKVVGAGG